MAEASGGKGGKAGWVVAAVVVAALVGYAVVGQRTTETSAGRPDDDDGAFVVVGEENYARVVVELENPVAVGPTPPMRVMRLTNAGDLSDADRRRLADAGGGAALYAGPEKFNDTWKEKLDAGQVKKDPAEFGHADADYPGFARYTFRVPESGEYEVWIRAFWVDDCGNSVDLAVDDGPLVALTDSNVGRWTWRRLETGERQARRYALEAGRDHVLTLCNREDDCYLDQILLRDAHADAPDPVGPQTAD